MSEPTSISDEAEAVKLTKSELDWLARLIGIGTNVHPSSQAARELESIIAARLDRATKENNRG